MHYVRRMQILHTCQMVGQVKFYVNVALTRSNFTKEAQPIDVQMILDIADGISMVHPMTDLVTLAVRNMCLAE
jgi:hypothetical protein